MIDNEIIGDKKMESPQNKVHVMAHNGEKVGAFATITSGLNEWYRLSIVVSDPALTTVDKPKLDRYIQNEMQAMNLVLHVVVNNEIKYAIYPPCYMAGPVWDIGFINAINGELMIINSMTTELPSNRLELNQEYTNFYSFISQKPNYRSSLGFDKLGVQKLDDLIMDVERFKQMIVKSMALPEATGAAFLDRLMNGISDLFGNISYSMLTKLINMNMVLPSDVEHSKSMSSPQGKKMEFGFLKFSPSVQHKRGTSAGEAKQESGNVRM
jgi:hypothetical protein